MASREFVRVVVPTRDGHARIAALHPAYVRAGIRPFYLVDARTSDHTATYLASQGAEFAEVTPAADRVEAMLHFIPDLVDAAWILRFDDDEFPSNTLLKWIARHLHRAREPAIGFSRREAFWHEQRLHYARMESLYSTPQEPWFLNPQLRAFRRDAVQFVDEIHTSGLVGFERSHWPRGDIFFVHFGWIAASYTERLRKLAGYERQQKGAGTGVYARHYLPERLGPYLRPTPFPTAEFDGLAHALAHADDGREPLDPALEERIVSSLALTPVEIDCAIKMDAVRARVERLPWRLRKRYNLV